ncbi:UDP-glucose 4-epimerase GalE [Novosphingobium bradum]|uniref:UDP-glucose 4-epimerase n=1 Tax=Novosphingobium bradum TaxID=1737444 RepID=A0ABV7IPN3_9SPHN
MRPDRFAVLVTGGAGYIGSHAVLALLEAGWPVVVLDNLVTGFRWAVDRRARFVKGDAGDRELVPALIESEGIGAILHFAGSVVVPESVADPLKYYRNNTATTGALLESAVACGVRHLVFSSTAAVYGDAPSVRVDERMTPSPINPYGRSKLMIEAMLADVAAAHPLNYCALRYFNVAGADPLARCGQSTLGATHLIKVAVEAALGTRDGIDVFGTDFATPDGTGVRDYIHVTDLAQAHVHALDLLIAGPGESHTMNCGYGRGFSVLEVLAAVERASGQAIARRFLPRRPGDPGALIADNGLIRACTAWQPRHAELDAIVGHALRWERILTERQMAIG